MAKRAALTGAALSDMKHAKPLEELVEDARPAAPPVEEKVPAETKAKPKPKGFNLRLNPDAWRQVKILAMQKDTSIHALLLDGLDRIFAENGLDQIAKSDDE